MTFLAMSKARSAILSRLLFVVGIQSPASVSAMAQAQQALSCPPSIPVTAARPKNSSTTWQVYIDSDLYLNSATPISGPPEMHGALADYTSRPGKNEWSYTYNLDSPFPDGKWLECGYGTHNEVTLTQRMPDTVKTCTFTYRKGEKAGQHAIKIYCR